MFHGSRPVKLLRLLAGIHVVAGLVSAAVCLARQSNAWPFALEFLFLVGFSSQLLLLGIVSGFEGMGWRQGGAAFLAGCAYLVFVAASTQPSPAWRDAEFILTTCGLVTLPLIIVAGGLRLISRRSRQAIRLVDDRDATRVLPFQFSIRHLLSWMLGVSAALGIGNMVRGNGLFAEGFGVLVFGSAFGAIALAMVWLLVWATLGRGTPYVRLLFVIFASGTLGFIPPYLMASSPDWRYWLWPGLTSAIAAIIAATLLVARRLGYRLVGNGDQIRWRNNG